MQLLCALKLNWVVFVCAIISFGALFRLYFLSLCTNRCEAIPFACDNHHHQQQQQSSELRTAIGFVMRFHLIARLQLAEMSFNFSRAFLLLMLVMAATNAFSHFPMRYQFQLKPVEIVHRNNLELKSTVHLNGISHGDARTQVEVGLINIWRTTASLKKEFRLFCVCNGKTAVFYRTSWPMEPIILLYTDSTGTIAFAATTILLFMLSVNVMMDSFQRKFVFPAVEILFFEFKLRYVFFFVKYVGITSSKITFPSLEIHTWIKYLFHLKGMRFFLLSNLFPSLFFNASAWRSLFPSTWNSLFPSHTIVETLNVDSVCSKIKEKKLFDSNSAHLEHENTIICGKQYDNVQIDGEKKGTQNEASPKKKHW